MTADWFPGEGRDSFEWAFLARLRADAAVSGLRDARPEDTHVHTEYDGLVAACVVVRGISLPPRRRVLQVGFILGDPQRAFLVGEWGTDDHPIDGWLQEEIPSGEPPPDPDIMGNLAYAWLDRQLARPVERWDWTTGRGAPFAEWRLADTGTAFHGSGPRLLFRRPRKPDRITRER